MPDLIVVKITVTCCSGVSTGITLFRPETLIDNPYTPKPVINKLFVYNKEVLPNDETGILSETIEYADHITLSSSQNSRFVVGKDLLIVKQTACNELGV